MANPNQKKNVSIQQVLAALLDELSAFPPAYLYQFSDLEGRDLAALESVWLQVNPIRRYTLLEDLEELADVDTLVSFDNVARMALADPDARSRAAAIRLLWEADDPRLAAVFLKMLNDDQDVQVRGEAATALGHFIYQGELEEIPEDVLHTVEDNLLQVIESPEEPLVRRRALESMGFSGRQEVPGLIRTAYDTGDTEWVASALFAMGRSADQSWEPEVKRMLRNPKADIQLEAVKAAGELSLESTRRILLDMLEEEAQDSEIRAAVIWSLSQIGGEEVRETLENLQEETEDDEEYDLLVDALDNLSFTEDVGMYGLFNFDELGQANEEIEDIEAYLNAASEDDAAPGNRTTSGEEEDDITKSAGKNRYRHGKPKKDR